MTNESDVQHISVEFEVFGHVQGCYFTKYAKEMCEHLGIIGWIKNCKSGSVMGKMQGTKEQIDQITQWINTSGCPGSKVEKCDFNNYQLINKPEFKNFSIRF